MNQNPKTGFQLHPQNINRNGRPKKGQALTEILSSMSDKQLNGKSQKYKEALAAKLWEMAIGGDIAAIKYIYDRIDGKPVETVDMYTVDESMIDVLNRVHEEAAAERETTRKET